MNEVHFDLINPIKMSFPSNYNRYETDSKC